MKNKRGDLATTILVFLVVTVCAAALYSFAVTSSNAKEDVLEVNFEKGAYLEMDSYEFHMAGVAREVFIETYLEITEYEENYINADRLHNNIVIYDFLRSGLDVKFKDLFLLKFSNKQDGVVEANLENDLFSVVLKDVEFSSESPGYALNHVSNISYEFNFVDQGIIGFRELDRVIKDCSSVREVVKIEDCFKGEFNEFEVSVGEVGSYFNVSIRDEGVKFYFLI